MAFADAVVGFYTFFFTPVTKNNVNYEKRKINSVPYALRKTNQQRNYGKSPGVLGSPLLILILDHISDRGVRPRVADPYPSQKKMVKLYPFPEKNGETIPLPRIQAPKTYIHCIATVLYSNATIHVHFINFLYIVSKVEDIY